MAAAVLKKSWSFDRLDSVKIDLLLRSLFNCLNENWFNNALSGVALRWLSQLETRTAVSVIARTSNFNQQTFICMSKTLLSKCSRKQLVETLLYEMVSVFIKSHLSETNHNNNRIDDDEMGLLRQAILKRAMDFLNRQTGTHLSFNHPFLAHCTTESYEEWIDIDNDVNVHKLNDTVVCITDDEELDDFDDILKAGYTSIEIINPYINIKPISDRVWVVCKDDSMVNCCCCIDYDEVFVKCFADTNFELNPKAQTTTCPICSAAVQPDCLNAHFGNDCAVPW